MSAITLDYRIKCPTITQRVCSVLALELLGNLVDPVLLQVYLPGKWALIDLFRSFRAKAPGCASKILLVHSFSLFGLPGKKHKKDNVWPFKILGVYVKTLLLSFTFQLVHCLPLHFKAWDPVVFLSLFEKLSPFLAPFWAIVTWTSYF